MSLKSAIKIAKSNTRITPRLHRWLLNNDGVQIHDDDLRQRVMHMLEPSTHDRSGVFHPSQLYQCQRAQLFEYYGVETLKEFNPTLQNLFNDGHFRHLRWQIMLMSAGLLTDIEVKVSMPEYRLAGSMDGVNMNEGWMFELKGTSQYRNVIQRGAFDAHIKQVNTYLLASGLDSAIIVYECKSSQQWQEIEVSKDERVVAEIVSILESLNNAIDSGDLPEAYDDCKNQTGATFNRCPFNSVCGRCERIDDITALVSIEPRASVDK